MIRVYSRPFVVHEQTLEPRINTMDTNMIHTTILSHSSPQKMA
jgi:hypothetical protein